MKKREKIYEEEMTPVPFNQSFPSTISNPKLTSPLKRQPNGVTRVTSRRGSGERGRVVDAVGIVSRALAGSVKVVVVGAQITGFQLVLAVVRVLQQGVDLVLSNFNTIQYNRK